MNITKFKLLKEMPDIKAGKIGIVEDNTVVFESDYGLEPTYFNLSFVQQKPDWFAPMLFTTEDGVDIYTGDEFYVLITESFKRGACVSGEIFITDDYDAWLRDKDNIKFFSTKKAAEDYLKPKFKIGDIVVFTPTLKIGKILGKLEDEEYCITTLFEGIVTINKLRLATNSEIISYYEKLGWVKGAKFTYNGIIYYVIDVFSNGHVVGLTGDKKEHITRYIENCELIKYPKSWEDLQVKFPVGSTKIDKRIFATEKQFQSIIAYAQLSQLVGEMNGDWQPDWTDTNDKFVITRHNNGLVTDVNIRIFHPLAFKSKEARDFSFHHHELLWKQYWQI